MIASIFKKYANVNDIIIFASGVSDSSEIKNVEFIREKTLIKNTITQYKNKQFIYFSSCSLEDKELKNTPYHAHKKEMESLIQKKLKNYIIFRLPNVIGFGGNTANIINFLINKVKGNEEFVIYKNATRNIIDIEHLYQIVSYILDNRFYKNKTINIAYDNNTNIIDILNVIEKLLNIKAKFKIVDKGYNLKMDNDDIKYIMQILNIKQPSLSTLLKKYKSNL